MRFVRFSALAFVLCALLSGVAVADIRLPSMGEASSAILSLEQERELGQRWLKSFRAQTRPNRDYALQEYVENLLLDIARHAPIEDRRLELLIVDNPQLNAFAVPGGIVGVHTGLLLHAASEAEFAAVLAHELAHLSQRHFARSVAERRASAATSLAGLLAGVILAAASGNSDAVPAAMSVARAAQLESALRYSRQHEQEADRIGLRTLVEAGYDASAAADMFAGMLQLDRRAGRQVPEYLRTHPLTERRLSDMRARALQYPRRPRAGSEVYPLMRARVEVRQAGRQAVRTFSERVKKNPSRVNRYGLALAQQAALDLPAAVGLARGLYDGEPGVELFGILYAELLTQTGEAARAKKVLGGYLQRRPTGYALNMALANAFTYAGQFAQAAEILRGQTRRRPTDPAVWYEYSEVLGLAGEVLALHKARAEYFMLIGAFNRAIRQLQFAQKEAGDDRIEQAVLGEMISRAARLRGEAGI
ncbi:MAG: M48 family metallopeptidase [Cellvibrionales bacterium]|nr:M48 family metallopeptidase [Cellvibrionales bacterium]